MIIKFYYYYIKVLMIKFKKFKKLNLTANNFEKFMKRKDNPEEFNFPNEKRRKVEVNKN
jgi:hypothetical protein